MPKDKLIVKADPRPPASKTLQVRVAADHYARISKAAMNCGMTNREMTDCLLGFALSRLVLEPIPLYKPGFKDQGEDLEIVPVETEDEDED